MFTGIIEESGKVKKISKGQLAIKFGPVISNLKIGDSIAVNGVCLTARELGKDFFTADVMPVTFKRTNLGKLKIGDGVNLERPVRPDGFMGGHFVLGHIDGTGTVLKKEKEGNAIKLNISFPGELFNYFVPRGSVAVDGVSLTISETGENYFQVSLIPETLRLTTFGKRKTGDILNLEADIIAKYVERTVLKKEVKSLTLDFLKESGY